MRRVNPDGLAPAGAYAHVVRAGQTVYISGQVPSDADGKTVGGTMPAQVAQVLANLQTALASQGAVAAHVAKITIFVTDIDAFRTPEVLALRRAFFGGDLPASTLVQVARLASPDYLVEIEAVAVLP